MFLAQASRANLKNRADRVLGVPVTELGTAHALIVPPALRPRSVVARSAEPRPARDMGAIEPALAPAYTAGAGSKGIKNQRRPRRCLGDYDLNSNYPLGVRGNSRMCRARYGAWNRGSMASR